MSNNLVEWWLICVLAAAIGIVAITKHPDWFDGSAQTSYSAPEQ